MKHALHCVVSQFPSICMQGIGVEKNNFLPTTGPTKKTSSFWNPFKKGKKKEAPKEMEEAEFKQAESVMAYKVMFGD